jgi:hypothetical protein
VSRQVLLETWPLGGVVTANFASALTLERNLEVPRGRRRAYPCGAAALQSKNQELMVLAARFYVSGLA